MAPPARPLPDDLPGLTTDIFLRLPPDDPAGIVRASAVCKARRRTLSDPAFAARYHVLHPTASVLGFLHRPTGHQICRVVPTATTTFRPTPAGDQRNRHPHDCRHGRALFYDYDSRGSTAGFVVWDPVAGGQHTFPETISSWTHQAVVCAAAAAGCDHRGCGGGPYIVATVAMGLDDADDMWLDDDSDDDDEDEDEEKCRRKFSTAQACFYSSDTGEWAMHIYTNVGVEFDLKDRPAVLVGDSLYFVGERGILLRYRYGALRRRLAEEDRVIRDSEYLSVIKPPKGGRRLGDVWVMTAEDGGLGLATMKASTTKLRLWAREAAGRVVGDAGGRWVQRRVIDLETLLPMANPKKRPCLSGIAVEDGSAIFVSTEDGVFSVGLTGSSLKAKKVSEEGNVEIMYPFVSFYAESLLMKLASGKMTAPVGNQ